MGVEVLTRQGHRVYVERDAGLGCGFDDERYRAAGAQICYSTEEIYGRSQMILSVSRPVLPEFDLLREGHILCGFLHLTVVYLRFQNGSRGSFPAVIGFHHLPCSV